MIRSNQVSKKRVSRTTSVQAPTGGLNAKDAISNMKETEAVSMVNWQPTPSDVRLRKGKYAHVTGFAAPVKTLAAYNTGLTKKIFAWSGANIYDVTIAGMAGSPVVTGLSNSQWQTAQMGTAGGYYLQAVNGTDDLQMYNGTTWQAVNAASTPAITGVNTNKLIGINNFKNRMFYIEKNTFKVWYLPVASIGGAAAALDLSGIFKLGGYLMAMANWTIDNAAGIDDHAVFITSEGEAALFKGTDPGDADAWALVGTFRMGRPIGRRCFCKAAADVLVVTTDGAFPLSKALLTDRTQGSLAATDKVSPLFNSDVQQFGNNYGWQPIVYPFGQKLIINVPLTENTKSRQYVMETTGKAWTIYDGWDAICWETLGDDLYYGSNNAVTKADIGNTDDGLQINATCQQAYSYFGNRGVQKRFTMARPLFVASGNILPSIMMSVDFLNRVSSVPASYDTPSAALWDLSPWDTTAWTQGDLIIKKWQAVSGVGYAGGISCSVAAKNIDIKWQSTDIVYENGGTF